MRILSIGFPLPGAAVDNHSFASAPTFFDYDAIVVDPLALSYLIEDIVHERDEHRIRSGELVANAQTGPDAVGLVDLLRDRQDETARLLANGGLAVSLAYPNVVHPGVAGFAGCDRYFWLPAPPGIQYREPFLRRGSGATIIPIEHEHPFGPFVDTFRKKLTYQAYFDTSVPAFDGAGRVFARSAGGAAIAVELRVGSGTIVFIPPPAKAPSGEERYAFSNSLQEAIRHTLRLEATTAPPDWLAAYSLPGLAETAAAQESAAEQLSEAQAAIDREQEVAHEIERFRALLWQEGRHGLEQPVRDALAQLGFKVIASDIDSPARIQAPRDKTGRQAALVEVDASLDAAGMEGHYRLRKRLEDAIASGTPRRGLLIINGHRTLPPSERPAQYTDALRVAAESMRYCVATTEQLFHAVRASLEGDEATVDSFRQRLLTTEGVLRED